MRYIVAAWHPGTKLGQGDPLIEFFAQDEEHALACVRQLLPRLHDGSGAEITVLPDDEDPIEGEVVTEVRALTS